MKKKTAGKNNNQANFQKDREPESRDFPGANDGEKSGRWFNTNPRWKGGRAHPKKGKLEQRIQIE